MIFIRAMAVLLVLFVAVALSVFLYHQHKGLLSESGVVEKSQEVAAKLLNKAEQQPSEESQNSASLLTEQGKTGLRNNQKREEGTPSKVTAEEKQKEEQRDEGSFSSLASSSFSSSLENKGEPKDKQSLPSADLPEEVPLENVPPTPSVLTPKEETRAYTPPALPPPPSPPFAGRSLEEITREEISAILQKRREAERRLDAARRGGWR